MAWYQEQHEEGGDEGPDGEEQDVPGVVVDEIAGEHAARAGRGEDDEVVDALHADCFRG